jgi:hypothetical protein
MKRGSGHTFAVYLCALTLKAVQAQVRLRCPYNEEAKKLAEVVVTEKGASQMISSALTIISSEAQSIQWLCGELESKQWQENAPVTQLQDCALYEQAAAQRIHLYGTTFWALFDESDEAPFVNDLSVLKTAISFVSTDVPSSKNMVYHTTNIIMIVALLIY